MTSTAAEASKSRTPPRRWRPGSAELLFQVITERDERASIAVASNAAFNEWGQTFPDPRLAAAVVDRLTYNAHIIQTGYDSYRLRTTRRGRATPRASTAARSPGPSPDHHDKEAPTDHR